MLDLMAMGDTLQIRNVPTELHAAVAERARERGLSISQYLLRRLAQIEGKPEISTVLDEHWSETRSQRHPQPGTATSLLSEDRDR